MIMIFKYNFGWYNTKLRLFQWYSPFINLHKKFNYYKHFRVPRGVSCYRVISRNYENYIRNHTKQTKLHDIIVWLFNVRPLGQVDQSTWDEDMTKDKWKGQGEGMRTDNGRWVRGCGLQVINVSFLRSSVGFSLGFRRDEV